MTPSAPEHPTEEEAHQLDAARAAQEEFDAYQPEMIRVLRDTYAQVKAAQRANGGRLDPETAVQMWYRVFAEFRVEQTLQRLIRKGKVTADGVLARARRKEL